VARQGVVVGTVFKDLQSAIRFEGLRMVVDEDKFAQLPTYKIVSKSKTGCSFRAECKSNVPAHQHVQTFFIRPGQRHTNGWSFVCTSACDCAYTWDTKLGERPVPAVVSDFVGPLNMRPMAYFLAVCEWMQACEKNRMRSAREIDPNTRSVQVKRVAWIVAEYMDADWRAFVNVPFFQGQLTTVPEVQPKPKARTTKRKAQDHIEQGVFKKHKSVPKPIFDDYEFALV
jgi:hypothetical protein